MASIISSAVNFEQSTSVLKQLRLRVEGDDYYGWKRKLKLEGRELEPLPMEVFSITDLEVLEASPERQSCLNFAVSEIPLEIGRLVHLRVLILDTNKLTEIPPEIAHLTLLERLALSNNNISSLPAEFSKLESLRSLHLANNELAEFPLEICCLENLEFLDMSDNRLRRIPTEIGFLIRLHTLNLFINKIKKLPVGLCKLKNLRTLWVGRNRLVKLPRYFGRLTNLDWAENYKSSNIDSNPLEKPPLDVCRQGPRAIRDFFKDHGKSWDHAKESESEGGEQETSEDELRDLGAFMI